MCIPILHLLPECVSQAMFIVQCNKKFTSKGFFSEKVDIWLTCTIDVKTKTRSGFEYSCELASDLTRSGYRDNDCSTDYYSYSESYETCICDADGCNEPVGEF